MSTNVDAAIAKNGNPEASSEAAIQYLQEQQQTQQAPPSAPPVVDAYIQAPPEIPASSIAGGVGIDVLDQVSEDMDHEENRWIPIVVCVVACVLLFHPRIVDATFDKIPPSLQKLDPFLRAIVVGILVYASTYMM